MPASTCQLSNFSHRRTGDTTYDVSMDFNWQGILPSGAQMAAKTRRSWAVQDKVGERFARMKMLTVVLLQPFAPISSNLAQKRQGTAAQRKT